MGLVGGWVVDMAGVARAKYVPTTRTEAFQVHGMGASPSWSVFCVDGSIAFTPELNVVGDLRIRIDPDDLRTVADGVAIAPGDLYLQDGTPSPMCARSVLKRTVDEAGAAGLRARVGAELECTLLRTDGERATGRGWTPYGLGSSLARSALLVDLAESAERAGLGVEQLHTEYGRDQREVSLSPADPVAAADAVVLGRAVIGRVAERHGLGVSFSPVPFAGDAGNGAHLHLSVETANGPVFSGGSGAHELTDDGASAIAGVLSTLPELIGVYAGSAVSARRLVPGNWAGAALCWGLENREAAVRLVAAGPASAHGANIELKVVDPSANPYLATAALLGSVRRGIELGLAPVAPVDVDPARSGQDLAVLPTHQAAALDALAGSEVARELLGTPVVEGLLAVRRHEVTAFAGLPLAESAEALRLAWSW
ncbi:glutamine synthetase [Nocardioides sp. MAH-18]|uniref:Glutamine synthetase n=1 Tax=Nocardioides agri TaxID=2682843 RepID=A0A6L6XXJ3_9ACTN|nr:MULTISPECIES: glutamine synthetase family protein [unclassified Nocardioides]MBA2952797.1 glutamine synthetase [Nocardioides sp. CGMCC 1.13656]MVQ51959.1 glutamine synthetase [Nocardioides sp. MAH-18]